MQIYSLGFDDFCEENFSLIGIHTTLEDYRLAYFLNKNLELNFKKSDSYLSFQKTKKQASFSFFNYYEKEFDSDWTLISNSFKKENQEISNNLLLTTETKTYLIPEKKKVDYFIKISGVTQYKHMNQVIDKINKIEQIITSYPIDKNSLKSKDFLIF